MKKHLMKTLMGTMMSFVMVCTSVNTQTICTYAKTTETTYQAGFWLLDRGQKVPESFEEFSDVTWSWGGWGTVNKNQTEIDEEKVSDAVCSLSDKEIERLLYEGETIRWFAEKKSGSFYHVYGEIIEPENPIPTEKPTYQAGFWLMDRGQKVPESFEEFSDVKWLWGGWGTVNKNQTEIDEEKVSDAVRSLSDKEIERLLYRGETIRWFAEKKSGSFYHVYGEIIEPENPIPTEKPTYQAGFWLMDRGQKVPESFEEFSDVKWLWGGWGTVNKNQTEINEEKVSDAVCSLSDKEIERLLNEGETIRWFAEKKSGSFYHVYGEIVTEDDITIDKPVATSNTETTICPIVTVLPIITPMVTPTMVPTVTPTIIPTEVPISTEIPERCGAFCMVLKQGQERPKSIDELAGCKWVFGGIGKIIGKEYVYGEEQATKRLVSVGCDAQNLLNDDEAIHWFAIQKYGAMPAIYGEIYNVNVENSIANGAEISDEDDLVVDTVEDMLSLDKVYEYGTKIKTRGYYKPNDGGEATYEIAWHGTEKKYSSFVTSVGQHVNLLIEDKVLNLRQLGAGECEEVIDNTSAKENNDDADRLNEAVLLIDEIEGGVIYIPEGEYRCASKVKFKGTNYSIQGEGSKSILYTDNGYVGDENFLTVGGDDLIFDSFRVEARETKHVYYYRQLSVMYANRISITNCEFIVEDNVIADSNSNWQYTNVTLYTGWHDVKIDNCLMIQMGCVERGACLGILDLWSAGCSGASITNCTMKQNAHDEMLGIFTKSGAEAAIENVYIANNNMHAMSASNVSPKTMAITIGYDNSKKVDNVRFVNNKVKAEVPSNFMTFGTVTNCFVEDNTFEIVHTSSSTLGAVFDTRTGVNIKNNDVTVKSIYSSSGVQHVFKRYGTFSNNKVDCQCYVYYFMYLGGRAINNEITLKKGTATVAYDPEEIKNNIVTSYGQVLNFIQYNNLKSNSIIDGNVFNYNYDDRGDCVDVLWNGAFVYAAFHAKLNGNIVTIKNNIINCPDTIMTKNKSVLTYGIGDDTSQTFIIEDNKFGAYKWVRSVYSQQLDKVSMLGNSDKDGKCIDLETRYTYGVQEVE